MLPTYTPSHNTEKSYQSWRLYEKRLIRFGFIARFFHKAGKGLFLLAGVILAGWGLYAGSQRVVTLVRNMDMVWPFFAESASEASTEKTEWLTKQAVREILENHDWQDFKQKMQPVKTGEAKYYAVHSLDTDLQDYIIRKLYVRTSRYIGIVVMDADTGVVKAMVSLDKTDPHNNPCTQSTFPAASVFKIVSAAAAVEMADFETGRKIPYNGRSHTLYKSQLKKKTNRYTNWVTLKEAFAKSVNPVFGKIGTYYLKKEGLADYAGAFGFNETINFELPLVESHMVINDEAYHWAEVASGFNQQTVLTPLHGAVLAGAIINGGILVEPTIIEKLMDEKARVVYRGRTIYRHQVVWPKTCRAVKEMMQATVRYGTASKSFRGYRKDRVLSKLDIGGKTGSMDNKTHDVRFDWFVGFAAEKDGDERIAVSVIVAHDKYIGTKSSRYARLIMKYYFQKRFEAKQQALVQAKLQQHQP